MAFTKEQLKEYRKKLKAQGVCVSCHKNKAMDGCVICKACSKKKYENKLKLVEQGLCRECRAPIDTPGRHVCINCEKRFTEYRNEWIQRRRIMGYG